MAEPKPNLGPVNARVPSRPINPFQSSVIRTPECPTRYQLSPTFREKAGKGNEKK
jgi:hypothetical protein